MRSVEDLHYLLVQRLEFDVKKACDEFGGSITSWKRTASRNKLKGGSSSSWHLDWLAFDIVLDDKREMPSMKKYMNVRGYRVIEKYNGLMAHVQYDWPIEKGFERKNMYSHLNIMLIKYSEIFERY